MADLPGAVDLADLGDFAYLAGARLNLTSFQPPADFEDLADFVDWGADFLEQEDFTGVEGAEHLTRFLGGAEHLTLLGEGLRALSVRMDSPRKVISDKPFRKSAIGTRGLVTVGRTSDG